MMDLSQESCHIPDTNIINLIGVRGWGFQRGLRPQSSVTWLQVIQSFVEFNALFLLSETKWFGVHLILIVNLLIFI